MALQAKKLGKTVSSSSRVSLKGEKGDWEPTLTCTEVIRYIYIYIYRTTYINIERPPRSHRNRGLRKSQSNCR